MSKATNITYHPGKLVRNDRAAVTGSKGLTVWMTGLSGSGKSTLAVAIEAALVTKGVAAFRLDGDNVREGLCKDLGFSAEERRENIRRVAEVACLMNQAGLVTLVSLITPTADLRALAREIHAAHNAPFLTCYVEASVETCKTRDPKGLYARAETGEIPNFTGISAPFDIPENAELVLKTESYSVETLIEQAIGRIAP